jgi:hypothetical protein
MPATLTTMSSLPYCSTARGDDLVGDLLGRALVAARPVRGAAKVVDDQRRALPAEEPADRRADAARAARDDGYPSVDDAHVRFLFPVPVF